MPNSALNHIGIPMNEIEAFGRAKDGREVSAVVPKTRFWFESSLSKACMKDSKKITFLRPRFRFRGTEFDVTDRGKRVP
jgi:hypothetical protein